MEAIILESKTRTILGKKVKKMRLTGQIPVVLYGHGIETTSLTVNLIKFTQILKKAGGSTLVDLKIDDKKAVKILLRAPQRHPVTSIITHCDMYKVKMSEKIKTEIKLEFVGESVAVSELEGNLIISRDNVEVECLPDALVSHIDVDLSLLKAFGDTIHISDIKVPEKMEILADPEDVVASVSAPRTEEEMEEGTTAEDEKAAVDALAEKPEEAEEKSE